MFLFAELRPGQSHPSRRPFTRTLALSAAFAISALLSSAPVLAKDLVLAISEGSSGGTDHARVIVKYQGLANALGNAIGKKIDVVFIREFKFLEDGMKTGIYDLVMARPSDYPARGMRDYGYQYVATAKPDGHCLIIVPKDSPIQKLADVKGKKIVLPNEAAYMTKFCAAELRTQGIDVDKESINRVREQGAVPFYLNNKFGDVGGIASYSGVAKKLDKDGMRLLHTSVAQPYFPLIADKAFTAAQVAAMQKAATDLASSPEGKEVLKTIGIDGFDTGTEDRLKKLLPWLGL